MPQTEPASPPDVSVILVNYRSAALSLRALTDAAASADAAGLRIEEIVVDGASGGEDVAILRRERPGATVLALDANRGFAAANNVGIARARGRWLLLVNPDAFCEPRALGRLLAYGEAHPRVGVVAPLLRNPDGSIQDNAFRRFPDMRTMFLDFCAPLAFALRGSRWDGHTVPRGELDAPRAIAHATGAALLVRARAAEAAGPLDEGFFMYLEETEWQRRIARAGWEVHVVPDVAFVHLGGGSSAGSPLASPAYLDSALRFHARPGLTAATIRLASAISLLSLRAAVALGLGSERIAELADVFARLRRELRRRDRWGRPRPAVG